MDGRRDQFKTALLDRDDEFDEECDPVVQNAKVCAVLRQHKAVCGEGVLKRR